MMDDPNLTPEQLALLATLNPDCPICYGENINALTSTYERTDPCLPTMNQYHSEIGRG